MTKEQQELWDELYHRKPAKLSLACWTMMFILNAIKTLCAAVWIGGLYTHVHVALDRLATYGGWLIFLSEATFLALAFFAILLAMLAVSVREKKTEEDDKSYKQMAASWMKLSRSFSWYWSWLGSIAFGAALIMSGYIFLAVLWSLLMLGVILVRWLAMFAAGWIVVTLRPE